MTTVQGPASQPHRCRRALIVEDDPAIRKLVGKLLLRSGIEVDTAYDGKQAIEKICKGGYSVLVLDLMVPQINGFEIIEYIKVNRIELPVVVVSAVSQQMLMRVDLDVVKLVITKPFDVDEFTKAVVKLCQEQ